MCRIGSFHFSSLTDLLFSEFSILRLHFMDSENYLEFFTDFFCRVINLDGFECFVVWLSQIPKLRFVFWKILISLFFLFCDYCLLSRLPF